jgi:septum formation protein
MMIQPYIYLASQSPRRRDLLKQIGVRFQIMLLRVDQRRIPDVDESPLANETAPDYVTCLMRRYSSQTRQ